MRPARLLISRRKKGGPEIAISLSREGLALRQEMERRVLEREEFLTSGLPREDLEIVRRAGSYDRPGAVYA
ncbi:hypothetical protein [Altererythrobacter lauratis]|uniref:DUF1127 domain-containing protein n=1 Tax=Alteraurantiacibacter lauratis TaxID=2054627 RepID=A0ABV7EF82_9SPHN